MEKAPCVMIWRADYAMCGNSCNGCAAAKKLYYQTEGHDPNSTYHCAIEETTIPREQHEEPGHVAEYPAYFARDGAQIHAHRHETKILGMQDMPRSIVLMQIQDIGILLVVSPHTIQRGWVSLPRDLQDGIHIYIYMYMCVYI